MSHLQIEDVRGHRSTITGRPDVENLSTVNGVVADGRKLRTSPNVQDDEVNPLLVPRIVGLKRGARELHTITEVQVKALRLSLLVDDGHRLTQLLISLLLRGMCPRGHRLHVLRSNPIANGIDSPTSEGQR